LKRNIVAWLLLPLSAAYIVFHYLIYFSRYFSQKSPKIQVICVGGLLAGGVGKTPIVREIAKKLPNSAVVMRGYGGTISKNVMVLPEYSGKMVGDEAKMLQLSGLSVFTGKNRLSSVKMAEKTGFSRVILDDGFQNPIIGKNLSLLVFDESIGIGNGFVLPAGPLREPVCLGMKRADAIIIIRNVGGRLGRGNRQKIVAVAKRLKKQVFYAQNELLNLDSKRILAFAGIGYPEKFFYSLLKLCQKSGFHGFISYPFPDHYQYSEDDLKKMERMAKTQNMQMVTTEKDWVRLSPAWQSKVKVARLETKIEDAFWDWLKNQEKK